MTRVGIATNAEKTEEAEKKTHLSIFDLITSMDWRSIITIIALIILISPSGTIPGSMFSVGKNLGLYMAGWMKDTADGVMYKTFREYAAANCLESPALLLMILSPSDSNALEALYKKHGPSGFKAPSREMLTKLCDLSDMLKNSYLFKTIYGGCLDQPA